MDIGVISMRYARALLKSALVLQLEDRVYEEMQTLAENYLKIPELRQTIDNPMIANEKKNKILLSACGGNVSELTERFLFLVLKEDRANVLQFIATSFVTLYRKHKNIIRCKLTTAVELDAETEQRIKGFVQGLTQADIEFHTEVDSSFIGGFKLEYDTYQLDLSVKKKLRDIRTQLTQN